MEIYSKNSRCYIDPRLKCYIHGDPWLKLKMLHRSKIKMLHTWGSMVKTQDVTYIQD